MAIKGYLSFYICAIAIQCIAAQYNGPAYTRVPRNDVAVAAEISATAAPAPCCEAAPAPPCPCHGLLDSTMLAASNGGGLLVSSNSPIIPVGVTVTSENTYEGQLDVCGKLPFIGATSLEGALPSNGAGCITYACGNGDITILTEEILLAPPSCSDGCGQTCA